MPNCSDFFVIYQSVKFQKLVVKMPKNPNISNVKMLYNFISIWKHVKNCNKILAKKYQLKIKHTKIVKSLLKPLKIYNNFYNLVGNSQTVLK